MDKQKTLRHFGWTQALFYMGSGLWPFCNVYFRELGFTGSQIGTMTAIGIALAAVALPVSGIISDRFCPARKLLIGLILIWVPLHLAIPLAGNTLGAVLPVFLFLAAANVLARSLGISLLDTWCGAEMDRIGSSYGAVRRYGSLAYVFSSTLAGLLLGGLLPTWGGCLLLPPTLLALALMARRWPDAAPREKNGPAHSNGQLLKLVLRNYYYGAFLLLALMFYIFLGILDLDSSYLLDEIGVSRSYVGVVGGFRAVLEIVAMTVLGRSKKQPPYWVLLTIVGVCLSAEHLLYPAVTGLPGMLAVTALSGIAGGIFYGIGANFVFAIVDHRAVGTAMAVQNLVKAGAGIAGGIFGGSVIDRWGVHTLTTGAGVIMLVLTAAFAVLCWLGRCVWKKPYANEVTA